jgi:hypothetical protein
MKYRVKIVFRDKAEKSAIFENVEDTFKANGNLYLTFGIQGQYKQYRLHELKGIKEEYHV